MEKQEKQMLYVSISTRPYKQGQLSFLDKRYQYFKQQTLTLKEFISKIKEGYHWGHNYMNPQKATKKSFVSSQCIVFNIETVYDLYEYIDKMEEHNLPLPTFAYPMKGNRGIKKLKLVYIFDKLFDDNEFAKLHTNIASAIKFDLTTPGNAVGNAMTNRHCGCPEYGMFVSQNVYTMNDFLTK